jgi:hypothetical protein
VSLDRAAAEIVSVVQRSPERLVYTLPWETMLASTILPAQRLTMPDDLSSSSSSSESLYLTENSFIRPKRSLPWNGELRAQAMIVRQFTRAAEAKARRLGSAAGDTIMAELCPVLLSLAPEIQSLARLVQIARRHAAQGRAPWQPPAGPFGRLP